MYKVDKKKAIETMQEYLDGAEIECKITYATTWIKAIPCHCNFD